MTKARAIPVSLHEPGEPLPRGPRLEAFLELGFRPLYIAGCAWALLSVALWIYAPQWLSAPLSGVAWHAHEMLWGFVATIAVGFLLTASATWTGVNPLKGLPLAAACLLWLVARIGYLAGGNIAFYVAAAAETAFFLLSALALLRVMFKGKSKRNYGIPFLVLGLGIANCLYLRASLSGNYMVLMQHFETGLICMAVIALLVARRVIPFFAMRAIPGLAIPMLTRSGQAQMVLGILAIVLGLAGQKAPMALALAATGLVGLYQIANWKPQAVLRKPILWILYLGYAAMGLGLLLAAAHVAGFGSAAFARAAVHVHVIGMAGFSVLIIGMVTRTALGHLGRPLQLDQSMVASYWLMLLAVVLRLAALVPSSAMQPLLHASAAAWVAAFILYLWRFAPLLIRPRL
ncbi:NnrS family protein [Pusillimonas caeni]|uniref:NnrS family protein n=1 Tax=Pusillimonas caeni TaxID=1348472 RepID=UPI000E5A0D23|nr:NnrS family protein [Pusillimonas caeni]TFL13289.1 NnrS family protein [Pusillimonas caeni]